MSDARLTIEAAARHSYGRLLACLAARCRDIAAAEDALADAFASALARWPSDGVPDKPEAWLLQTAKNRLIDSARRRQTHLRARAELLRLANESDSQPEFPDHRLPLLFVCTHPAIPPSVRTALMLQTVFGLDAARIASAFLLPPATLSQRLVRAKNRLRRAAVPFEIPDPAHWPARLDSVLEAIYSAYTTGQDACPVEPLPASNLAAEALALARLLASLLPSEPEALGLLALLLHCEARRPARLAPDGSFVPLDRQDTSRWLQPLLHEAESALHNAARLASPGRFQLEAAIHSLHSARLTNAAAGWPDVLFLYDALLLLAPTLGARVSRAAALAHVHGPAAALADLDGLQPHRIASYQPYWAVRAHLLRQLGRHDDARLAYTRAAGLTEDTALRAFLLHQTAV